MVRIKPFAAAIVVLLMAGSCRDPFAFKGWDKDYDQYQIGAYINGEEYHEQYRSLVGSDILGFYIHQKDSLLLIRSSIDISFRGPKDDYTCYIIIIVNSSSYKAGDTYSFNRRVWEYDYFNEFKRGNYELFGDLPLVIAAFVKWPVYENENNPFVSTDGVITVGAFDGHGHNSDTILFSLKAEDEYGNSLIVEDGYCKKFLER